MEHPGHVQAANLITELTFYFNACRNFSATVRKDLIRA
jgi:hypothetical protein